MCCLGFQIPQISIQLSRVLSMEALPGNLWDLKDLPLMSWCQISQHTFGGLVETMPQQVKLAKLLQTTTNVTGPLECDV